MRRTLAARLLRTETGEATEGETFFHKIFRVSGRLFTALENGYRDALRFALAHRVLVVAGAVLLLGGSLALSPLVGYELLPTTDEGEVRVNVEMEVGTRVAVVDEKMQQIEAIVAANAPEVESVVSTVGGHGWHAEGTHTGQVRIALKPLAVRTRSSEEIASILRKELADIPGATIRTRAGQGLFILRMGTSEDKVEVEVRGHDLDVADALAARVKTVVEETPGVTDARISRESGSPEDLIIVDRQKAADMRLTVSRIADMLQTVLSGTRASNFREAGDEFRIIVQMKDAERMWDRPVARPRDRA